MQLTIDRKTQKPTHKKRGQFGLELVYFSNYILQTRNLNRAARRA